MTSRYRVSRIAIVACISMGAVSTREGMAQAPADDSSAPAALAICVQCSGPEATYRCEVKDSQRVDRIRGVSRALEFVCISELAKAGGHQSCRVGTGYAGPCIGVPRLIDLSKSGDAVVVGEDRAGSPASGGDAPPPETPASAAVKPNGPPQTLEELARVTVSKSKKQIAEADEKVQQAGSAVGKALKKSWACLSSLFTDCK